MAKSSEQTSNSVPPQRPRYTINVDGLDGVSGERLVVRSVMHSRRVLAVGLAWSCDGHEDGLLMGI
ncbi:uncharacterized protein PG998_008935 [Apiospora kogelbergensis]|uniref:uncharacterized protein n=1 Tax=Apiospora kogelbergensis TaxID=1337665 RepID=UPI0031300D95